MPETTTVKQDNPNVPSQPSGGVAQPGQVGVQRPSAEELQRRDAARNEAAEIRAAEERARAEEIKRDAELREQASGTIVEDEQPPTKVGDGGVQVQYLGTSDAYDFGPSSNEDTRHVLAYAGGEPVDVPQDVADAIANLTHDKFKVIQ